MKIIIFGKDTCCFCLKSKELLTNNNIEYKYILMDKVSAYYQTNYLNKVPITYKTVPQIFIDNKFIGGYSDLEPIINKK